ncbi:MAG: radical SAM protein [Sedimentisphaerales bacterium]|nr:radical SAM protein [Sedimentisphaerales bacterium]
MLKQNRYYVMYDPLTFKLMDKIGEEDFGPVDIAAYLSGMAAGDLNEETYIDYLRFDIGKERHGVLDHWAMDSYSCHYVGNQIAMADPASRVILADGKRRRLAEVIESEGVKPAGVFITSITSNFPTAVAASIALNHGGIPVIIGGVHVSSCPEDVETYIRKHVPHPELVSLVRGPGDSTVIKEILNDLQESRLKKEYVGRVTIEDGVWGAKNLREMPKLKPDFFKKLPLIGSWLAEITRVNVIAPYLGCPYSCKFCSMSSLPRDQRRFTARSEEDFVAELRSQQETGAKLSNRFYLFLPENLILGGKRLEETLDLIIESDLKISYATQISIEIAEKDRLLAKLRRSGATHFFIGLESLDIRNLEWINKHAVGDIKKSGLSVREYYSRQLKKIASYGISVNGAFILGLPYDYFNSPADHSGRDIAEFCIEEKVGLQATCLNDLPGSENFTESQAGGAYLYGKQGSMDYLLGLCTGDLAETNRVPPDSLKSSPLIVSYMVWDAIHRVCSKLGRISLRAARDGWRSPTKNGELGIGERLRDSFGAIAFQMGIATFRDIAKSLARSQNGCRGYFERLYDQEKNADVRAMLKDWVQKVG